jgi:hypothetical protein
MKRAELELMSVDHLWKLRAEISGILATKITEEKKLIEGRLVQLRAKSFPELETNEPGRRPYPRVFPKFSKSGRLFADLGRSREAATVADSAAQIRQTGRRI